MLRCDIEKNQDVKGIGRCPLFLLRSANMKPCPNCGKNLEWFGIKFNRKEFDLEGKRWYEYAGFKMYCKYCNCRLKGSYHLRYFEPPYALIIPLIIIFLADAILKKYGRGMDIAFIIFFIGIVYLLYRKVKYERWEEPKSKKP